MQQHKMREAIPSPLGHSCGEHAGEDTPEEAQVRGLGSVDVAMQALHWLRGRGHISICLAASTYPS